MVNKTAIKTYDIVGGGTMSVPIRLTDNGDGTWSEGAAGGGGGGGAVTVADGADVTQGAVADAVVAAGAAGTIGAKLRAVSRDIGALLAQIPATLGVKASAASMSVVIASDDAQLGAEATGFTPSAGATGVRGRLSEVSTAVRAFLTAVISVASVDATVAATNITTQNLNPTTGTPTAGSVVTLALNGQNVAAISVTANALGATVAIQITYDGVNWDATPGYSTPSLGVTTSFNSISSGTTGRFTVPVAGAKGIRLAANSATVTGTLTAAINAGVGATPFIANNALAAFGTAVASMSATGGSTAVAQLMGAAAPTNNTDYSAVAWTTTGAAGATLTDAAGAVCSFDVNVATFVAGSSTGLDVFLESSRDGGTTWDTHWQCEAFTAAGHATIPPVQIPGARRRMRYVNRSGAATTATTTVIGNRHSVAPSSVRRQFFDRTSTLVGVSAGAVSVGATTAGWINGASQAGAGYETGGASNIGATIPVLAAATTGATYQLQVCPFNSTNANDWVGVGTAVQASATAAVRLAASGITERFFRVICTVAGAGQTGSYIALTAG